ncbi:hypothetical protein RB595_010043 [Gaeumannomyces hyphopodioides]
MEVAVLPLLVTCLQLVAGIVTTLKQVYDFSQELKNVPAAIRNLVLDVQAAQGYLENIQHRVTGTGVAGNGGSQGSRRLVNNVKGARLCLETVSTFAIKHVSSMQSYQFLSRLIYMIQHAEIMKHRDELRNRLVYLEMLQGSRPEASSFEETSSRPSSDPGLVPLQGSAIDNNMLLEEPPRPPRPSPSRYSRWSCRCVSRNLVEAARRGDVEEAQRLIAAGADIDYQSRGAEPKLEGKAALHAAAEMGHTTLVLLLLQRSASPNLRTVGPSNDTALHLAAGRGHLGVLQQLLDTGTADVDAKDAQGFSPLQRCEDQVVMAALLEAGADPRRRLANSNGTVLHWAASRGQSRLVRQALALDGITIDEEDAEGLTPLQRCIDEAVMAELLKAGADPKRIWPGTKDTLLHLAASKGYFDVLGLLLSSGRVDLDAEDAQGLTPLLKSKSEAVLTAILKAGADPMRRWPGSGNTVLHHAADSGWTKAVRQLVAMRAVDVQAKNADGLTPLKLAMRAHDMGAYGFRTFGDIAAALTQSKTYAKSRGE